MSRLFALFFTVALALALSACSDDIANPRSLWINYSMREIDLVLVDYEPPPF